MKASRLEKHGDEYMLKRDHDYYFQAHQQIHTAESAYLDFIVFVACRTGVIFCVFRWKRGEGEASSRRELRTREGSLKNPARPHTIVQAVPAFKYERSYLIGYLKTRDPRMFSKT